MGGPGVMGTDRSLGRTTGIGRASYLAGGHAHAAAVLLRVPSMWEHQGRVCILCGAIASCVGFFHPSAAVAGLHLSADHADLPGALPPGAPQSPVDSAWVVSILGEHARVVRAGAY